MGFKGFSRGGRLQTVGILGSGWTEMANPGRRTLSVFARIE
jgi:hypothetical protein